MRKGLPPPGSWWEKNELRRRERSPLKTVWVVYFQENNPPGFKYSLDSVGVKLHQSFENMIREAQVTYEDSMVFFSREEAIEHMKEMNISNEVLDG